MTITRKLNRKPTVLILMGWGNSKLYQNIKDRLFVGPVKIGLRASAWPSDEISILQDAYIAGKPADEIRALVEKLEAARGNVRKESVNETNNSETVKLSIEPCVGNRPFATTCPVSPGTHGEFRMNYYPHHVGDYRRDTAHLSLLEHGVYRQLLDTYYLTEQPLPKELELVFRKLSAKSEDERKVVENILNEFFVMSDKGWIHTRCNKEIKEYQAKASRATVNGKRGGRPKKTKEVISGLSNETQEKANQEPLTMNQEPIAINQEPINPEGAKPQNPKPLKADASRGSRLPADWQLPESWGEWAAENRRDLTFENIREIAAAFKDHWISQPGKYGVKADWEATWRNWIRKERPSKALSFADRKIREKEESQLALDAWARGEKADPDSTFIEGELGHG